MADYSNGLMCSRLLYRANGCKRVCGNCAFMKKLCSRDDGQLFEREQKETTMNDPLLRPPTQVLPMPVLLMQSTSKTGYWVIAIDAAVAVSYRVACSWLLFHHKVPKYRPLLYMSSMHCCHYFHSCILPIWTSFYFMYHFKEIKNMQVCICGSAWMAVSHSLYSLLAVVWKNAAYFQHLINWS